MRGAYGVDFSGILLRPELSPRAWGVRDRILCTRYHARVIPTCVRLTSRTLLIVSAGWSYPHVRGAYWGTEPSEHSARESSPRAWGLHTRRASATVFARVIPTCVGLTVSALDAPHCIRSYPHVCGAYFVHEIGGAVTVELSPRVWGLPVRRVAEKACLRVIPTCVGLTLVHLR